MVEGDAATSGTCGEPPGVSAPWQHRNEAERLESLATYRVLDSAREPAFDGLVAAAARLCGTPTAVISLIDADRQWFKARVGTDTCETARDISFCTHVVASGAPLLVRDAARDARFATSPLVTEGDQIRAYAGVPLVGRDGLPLGALAVNDVRPRRFTRGQVAGLQDLAEAVVGLLELRRADLRLLGAAASRPAGGFTFASVRDALDAGQLVPYFQPVVDLTTGRPHAVEALLRWEHPEDGLIAPGRFLPLVEATGLILPVGRHVLRASLRQLAELIADGPAPWDLVVTVNVSPQQLTAGGFAAFVADSLAAYQLDPGRLAVELTETAPVLDDATALAELHALREQGIGVLIDDYGAGYSGLQRLLDLPVTGLKLDRAIVSQVPYSPRAHLLARSTVTMATDLGLAVVAEGIELPEQRQAMADLGCRYGQGFLFAPALPSDALTERLARWAPITVTTPAGVTALASRRRQPGAPPPKGQWRLSTAAGHRTEEVAHAVGSAAPDALPLGHIVPLA